MGALVSQRWTTLGFAARPRWCALTLALTGCQSWFYVPGPEVPQQWARIAREGGPVDLIIERRAPPTSTEGSAPAPTPPRPPPSLGTLHLKLALPAQGTLLRGLQATGDLDTVEPADPREPLVVRVDARRVSRALVLRSDHSKLGHNTAVVLWGVGATVGVVGVVVLLALTVPLLAYRGTRL